MILLLAQQSENDLSVACIFPAGSRFLRITSLSFVLSFSEVIIHLNPLLNPLTWDRCCSGCVKFQLPELPLSSGHGWGGAGAHVTQEQANQSRRRYGNWLNSSSVCSVLETDQAGLIWQTCSARHKLCVIANTLCVYLDRVLCEPAKCGISFCRLYSAHIHSQSSFREHCTLVPSAWKPSSMQNQLWGRIKKRAHRYYVMSFLKLTITWMLHECLLRTRLRTNTLGDEDSVIQNDEAPTSHWNYGIFSEMCCGNLWKCSIFFSFDMCFHGFGCVIMCQ